MRRRIAAGRTAPRAIAVPPDEDRGREAVSPPSSAPGTRRPKSVSARCLQQPDLAAGVSRPGPRRSASACVTARMRSPCRTAARSPTDNATRSARSAQSRIADGRHARPAGARPLPVSDGRRRDGGVRLRVVRQVRADRGGITASGHRWSSGTVTGFVGRVDLADALGGSSSSRDGFLAGSREAMVADACDTRGSPRRRAHAALHLGTGDVPVRPGLSIGFATVADWSSGPARLTKRRSAAARVADTAVA